MTIVSQDVGIVDGLRILHVTYPGEWKKLYDSGQLLSQWRTEKPGFFDGESSGIRGSKDLFAQYCLAYVLAQDGYRSTTWYKLALEPARSSTERSLAVRQALIRQRVGDAKFETLREDLLKDGLTLFKGEPDLFCWRDGGDDWFFAEAKDEDTKDGLHLDQIRWMFAARRALGENVDFRIYFLKAVK